MRKRLFWVIKGLLALVALLATLAIIYLFGRYVLGVHLLSTFWRRLVIFLSFILFYNVVLNDPIDRLSDFIAKKISKE